MAIFLGNKEPQWPSASMPAVSAGGGHQPMFPHYGMNYDSGQTYGQYFPGFSDDAAAGSSISIKYADAYGRGIERLDYWDKTGTAITDGVWNGGFTAAEVTGAEYIVALLMDETDECLYFLAMNTGTAPDQFKLCSVDKEGVVVQSFAWTNPSGTTFDHMGITVNWQFEGGLHRTGGDGSGNFVYTLGQATIGEDGLYGHGHRGAVMTFAASDGALTETQLMAVDTNQSLDGGYLTKLDFGPTSNNIRAGIMWAGSGNGVINRGYGSMVNITTGVALQSVYYPGNMSMPGTASALWRTFCVEWRDHYIVAMPSVSLGVTCYAVDDIHNMVDEMAALYGIL